MSKGQTVDRDLDDDKQKVLDQLHEDFESWDKSRQAVYHDRNGRKAFSSINRHDDGERIYKDFNMKPFHEVLETAKRRDHPLYRYPESFLNNMIHVDDAELWALEDGDLEFFADEPRTRQKVMEFLARDENSHILSTLGDGGTETHAHAKPGKGKTSFGNVLKGVRNVEINNETVLYCLTLDELEQLPLAPYMTILKPAGVDVDVEAKPVDYRLPSVTIGLKDVFRDVVTYEDPVDLYEKVVPGGIYGVLPDPRFRKCEKLVQATYTPAWEAEESKEITPLRDFNHALLEVRAKEDVYLHRTELVMDEFTDLCPKNPEADANDENAKVGEFPARLGKLRKKNGSLTVMSHTIKQAHEDILAKERWFVTLPETPLPSTGLAGIGEIPVPKGLPTNLDKGEAVVWNATNYAEISWANPYRQYRFRGEINISYPRWEEATDAI